MGWGTIIFLAALAGVDTEQYEASIVDGAGRLRRMWHVTLPAIRTTIVILLILRLGNFLDTGFEQIYLMTNSLNRDVADVFDTYVYTVGITQGAFSYSTAVGLFKSVVGIILVLGSNKLAKNSAIRAFTSTSHHGIVPVPVFVMQARSARNVTHSSKGGTAHEQPFVQQPCGQGVRRIQLHPARHTGHPDRPAVPVHYR